MRSDVFKEIRITVEKLISLAGFVGCQFPSCPDRIIGAMKGWWFTSRLDDIKFEQQKPQISCPIARSRTQCVKRRSPMDPWTPCWPCQNKHKHSLNVQSSSFSSAPAFLRFAQTTEAAAALLFDLSLCFDLWLCCHCVRAHAQTSVIWARHLGFLHPWECAINSNFAPTFFALTRRWPFNWQGRNVLLAAFYYVLAKWWSLCSIAEPNLSHYFKYWVCAFCPNLLASWKDFAMLQNI